MRWSALCEEEAFIHLFCLFSKTNRGQDYAATLIALCLLHLNSTLGFTLHTFMVISKIQASKRSPPAKSDYLDFYRLQRLRRGARTLICLSPCWNGLCSARAVFSLNIRWRHSTSYKPAAAHFICRASAWCVVHVDISHERNVIKILFIMMKGTLR